MKRERLATTLRKAKQRAFLRALRRYRSVAMAAARVGTTRSEPYRWARKDATFKAQFDDVIESMLDQVESSLYAMATGGVTKPVVSAGRHVTDERVFDVRAAELLLRAYRTRFRERAGLDVQVSGGTTHQVKVTKEFAAQHVAEVAKLLAEAGVTLGGDPLLQNAEVEGRSISEHIADARFRHETAPLFSLPAPDEPPAPENDK